MRRGILTGVAAGLALAAAAVAVGTAPDSDRIVEPFLVTAEVGEVATGRLLSAEVSGVTLARTIVVKYRQDAAPINTDGVWVVVDATVTPQLDILTLTSAQLRIGNVHYGVSSLLPEPTMLTQGYGAGIPQRGDLVFEIPRSALDAPGATSASIVFLPVVLPRLDTVPAIVVDLTRLEVGDTARIDPVVVVDQ